MSKILVAALVIATALGTSIAPDVADAAQTRAKAKHSTDQQRTARRLNSVARVEAGSSTNSNAPVLRDRSTINLPNGRLNGKEFFESLQERSTGAGE